MKKQLFLCASLAALMCACSSDNVIDSSDVNTGDMVPITLGMRMQTATATTRGAGSVGGTAAEGKTWNNEDVKVIMTIIPELLTDVNWSNYNGQWQYTKHYGDAASLGQIFPNVLTKPLQVGSDWTLDYTVSTAGVKKYYPTSGSSDFFAYHADDAANGATIQTGTITPNGANTIDAMKLPIHIDGSQDLLAGKAENAEKDGERVGFSAKRARDMSLSEREKQPVISMKHLLTRLNFNLQADDKADDAIVTSIKVQSYTKGNMIVAYNTKGTVAAENLVEWEQTPEYVTLKKYAEQTDPKVKPQMVPYGDIDLQAGESLPLNGSLFVSPGWTSYQLVVTVKFVTDDTKVDGAGNYTAAAYTAMDIPYTIKLSDGSPLQVGTAYTINVMVNGLQDIVIYAELADWAEGENINVDTDAY